MLRIVTPSCKLRILITYIEQETNYDRNVPNLQGAPKETKTIKITCCSNLNALALKEFKYLCKVRVFCLGEFSKNTSLILKAKTLSSAEVSVFFRKFL